jgi:hypothetical protein
MDMRPRRRFSSLQLKKVESMTAKEHAAEIKWMEEKLGVEMQRKDEEHAAEMQHKDDKHTAVIKRKDEEHAAEV